MADRTSHPDDTARRPRVGIRLFVGCCAFALLFALPAWSGNLVQVRVGNHPTYTRVVFEFDAPSGYRIERRAAGESENTILVTLDAASRARNIVSKSKGVESIDVDGGSGRAVAHITTRQVGLPIREMILTNPPRVVLDLMIPGAEAAPQVETAEAKPEPVEPEAQPEPTAAQPEEIVVAEPEPQPAEIVPESEVASEPLMEVPDLAIADAPLAVVDMADLMGEAEAIEPDVQPVVPEVPSALESRIAASRVGAKTRDETAPFDLKLAGMIGAGVLALLVFVALVIRSRGSKPTEMDVTALADEADAAAADPTSHEGRLPEGGFAMAADLHEASEPGEDFEYAAVESQDDENKPIESAGVATDARPGLFDESQQEEDAMSMDNQDLPTTQMDSEAPTQLGIGAAAIGADMDSSVAHLIKELERRVAHMEARLDESNEARESLERQVEAQAEELRVQRAAIARTQRAVRSLNRPDEDQATEPALRDPTTPTS